MQLVQPVKKNLLEISNEWDNIAELRLKQITSDLDISHNYILLPIIEELMINTDCSKVLDIGCGIGYDTKKISNKVNEIIGIDISYKSIELANQNIPRNVHFYCDSMESFSKKNKNEFSLGIANMVLMTTVNLDSFIKSVSISLKHDSYFIFTITHPWFWPFYWNYNKEKWFNYNKEIQIEANFSITNQHDALYRTTHIHRPLSMYLKTIKLHGFIIDQFIELYPSDNVHKKFSEKWKYPRFIAIKCKKR